MQRLLFIRRKWRVSIIVPEPLATTCRRAKGGVAWLEKLPSAVDELAKRWSLTIGDPFKEEVSCAWVAPAELKDGTSAVLKLGMPHMESEHEAEGLRFWDGDPTVRLIDSDNERGAILLERCEPGTFLRTMPEPEQDVVIASLLRRLWREPPTPNPFRHLSVMTAYWSEETIALKDDWLDAGIVRDGLRLFKELPRTAPTEVLLATDLHAGNVLASRREPWLVIDPKPFVGDPAYDATQHLFNCMDRMRRDPESTIKRLADLLGLEGERVLHWTFARAAAEARSTPENRNQSIELARRLARTI